MNGNGSITDLDNRIFYYNKSINLIVTFTLIVVNVP